MTRFDASRPRDRGALVADAITAHRKRDSDRAVFEAVDDDRRETLSFADGQVTFVVTDDQYERLTAVLDEFPVFKIAQPETRKADADTVVVSAVTDQKHAAEFVEASFRSVYGFPEDYRLWVAAV
ncbi:MAG: hypothetical protein ABEI96_00765 [Haloarculaceae archaeon]